MSFSNSKSRNKLPGNSVWRAIFGAGVSLGSMQ